VQGWEKKMEKVVKIERIPQEVDDYYSDDDIFNINSWGADLSFRELITMYQEGELAKPELQRYYVWDKTEDLLNHFCLAYLSQVFFSLGGKGSKS
jgi:hypothetical protein